jgi:CRP/FNR family transcriptional regulator
MADLHEHANRHESIYKELFYTAGIRLSSNIQRLENVSLSSSYSRLVHQLVCFAEQFGEKSSAGTKILLPLTNSDLANVLNLTRETVSRSFSRLQKKGLAIGGTYIIIPDISKLRQEIN